jgi:hypothetical protein
MAIYKTLQSGNMLDASTWGLVNAASYLAPASTGSVVLTTSYKLGTAFNPGVCTITEIGVALGANTNTAGTITIALHDTATVAGTEVTMNCTDLPQDSTTVTGGWIYFKLPSPVTLASTNYQVKMLKSADASAAITIRTPTGTTNYARQLVTTATGTPTTGDETHIAGNTDLYSGSTQFVMTMNNTASTQFGAMSISKSGHVKWATSASTAYLLTLAGPLTGYIGFEWTRGDRTTRCPSTSSMEMVFVNATAVDRGFDGYNGTFTEAGATKTSWMCRLNTDEAIASTSLGVDTDTGWLDNDQCVIATSNRTATQSELFLLNGDAGADTLTIDSGGGAGGGLAFAHDGNVNTVQSEIVNMTRNVNWRGTSVTLTSYINLIGCVIDISWASYKWFGSATALKRGFQLTNTTESALAEYCVFRDGPTSSYGFNSAGAATANLIFRHNLIHDIVTIGFLSSASSVDGVTLESNICIRPATAGTGFHINDLGTTVTNNISIGGAIGILFSENNTITGTISGNTARGATTGMTITTSGGIISNTTAIRNNGAGLTLTNCYNTTIDGGTLFGNANRNITLNTVADTIIKSFNSDGDTGYPTTSGVDNAVATTTKNLRIIGCNFSQGASPRIAHTNDVLCAIASIDLIFENCTFGAVTRIATQTSMLTGTGVGFSRIGGVAGVHAYNKKEGTHTIDTTIFETSPSFRMTPSSATGKLVSCGRSCAFRSAVASGSALTVSVRVRESVVGDGTAYNGAFPRLLVKRNISAGITADTVLATATSASEGAWETISGTTATVTDDAILEFAVDCDGTAGWINIENWDVTTEVDSRGMKYWVDGAPIGYNNNLTPDFPAVTNVLTTDTVDGVQGTYVGPSESDVKNGVSVGQTTGTYVPDFPAVTNVLTTDTVDNVQGTYVAPAPANVLNGVSVGQTVGTYTPDFPAVTNVLTTDTVDGVQGTYNGTTANNVRSGVAIGQTTGTITFPAVGDVKNTVQYGAGGTEYTGNYVPDFPAVTNVLTTDTVDGVAGTYVGASANDVRKDVAIGQTVGTIELPVVTIVLAPNQYGANGTEFTGTLVPSGDVPDESDVRFGVVYDDGDKTGNVVLPLEAIVVSPNQYGANGTEFTGSLVVEYPAVDDVRKNVTFGGTLVGTVYVPSPANVRKDVPVEDTVGTLHVPIISPDDVRFGVDF